jgi:glycosyltransferase involved in cell wall biosynthesis
MLMIVTDEWRPHGGGRERYLEELVSYASARGRRVSVLCGSRAAAAVFSDCSVRRGVRPIRDHRMRAAVRDARAANPALRVLALTPISGATHYQLHDGLFEHAFAAERDVMRSRLRRATFPLGLALNRHRQRLMRDQKSVVLRARAVMAFSRRTAREVVERFGVDPARIVVERPGVDLSRFRPGDDGPSTAGPGRLRLAFVGRNFALKGLCAAVAAVSWLHGHGIEATLTVAGAGRSAPYLSLAERIGVGTAVRFVGPLAPDAVADLYRRSDLLVHPTFHDPFPRVVVEALACGCPVITTARCGASEVLTHGSTGFVIEDPSDAAAIARFASELTDAARLSAMRRAAAQTGRRFDAGGHFDRVIDWLDSTQIAGTT